MALIMGPLCIISQWLKQREGVVVNDVFQGLSVPEANQELIAECFEEFYNKIFGQDAL